MSAASKVTKHILFGLSVALAAFWCTDAAAYPRYNDGCQNCHGHFTDATSLQGNVFPADNKHAMHRSSSEMATECNLCHTNGDKKNPFLGSSNGTSNNTGLGCAGCHGREEDAGNDQGGGTAMSEGRGAGLRQHHSKAGWSICKDCHWDADPANYAPVGEDVVPPYYGTVDTLANNPLNPTPQAQINENWTIGDFIGMDNDGDQVYDAADQGNLAPTADHGGPYATEVDILMAFDGSLSADPDGTIVLYEWTFGDTNTGTGVNPTHTYTAADTYDVSLKVTDDGGATHTAFTVAVVVLASPSPPVNQTIGMIDKTSGAMVEADCRACHTAPPPPERHHTLYGTERGGATPPYTDPSGGTTWTCINCHSDTFLVERDCVVCHTSNAHHGTTTATSGTCTACHGDVVDDMSDGHRIPGYDPSLVTPSRSGANGLPLNSYGDGAGACDYCHNDDGLSTPVIENNQNLHHGTGLDVGNCTWCHANGDPLTGTAAEQMRACEGCHGPESLHNIQADSPNANNPGSLVVGGEDAGYGHVGRDAGPGDSDCWGCHGFGMASVGGPDTSALVPTVYGCEPSAITAGTDTRVLIVGSAFTNTTGSARYTSDVVLRAADGSTATLTPDFISEEAMVVTIGGDTAPGGYRLQAVKTNHLGHPVASNPVSISIQPRVLIREAACEETEETTVTIRGSGFGGYAEGSGTAVTGTSKSGNDYVTEEATIVSWSDTTIVAHFDSCPDDVTVHSVFGNTPPEEVTLSKPGKGKGRDD